MTRAVAWFPGLIHGLTGTFRFHLFSDNLLLRDLLGENSAVLSWIVCRQDGVINVLVDAIVSKAETLLHIAHAFYYGLNFVSCDIRFLDHYPHY